MVGVLGRLRRPQRRKRVDRAGGYAASTIHRNGIRKGCALPYLPLQTSPITTLVMGAEISSNVTRLNMDTL